jgi:hypothetical protein
MAEDCIQVNEYQQYHVSPYYGAERTYGGRSAGIQLFLCQ